MEKQTARWFSKDRRSSVSGVIGVMTAQYSIAAMDDEGTLARPSLLRQIQGHHWRPCDDCASEA